MKRRRWLIALGAVVLTLGVFGAVWWAYHPWIITWFTFSSDAEANTVVATEDLPLVFLKRDGTELNLTEYRGKKMVVLVVVRGAHLNGYGEFCFFCVAQTGLLTAKYDEFKKRGAEVVMVFPGSKEEAGRFVTQVREQQHALEPPFPVVLDTTLAAVDKMGIRNTVEPKAKPSTYILDKQGNVVWGYVGKHMSDRPTPDAILTQLDKLNATP